MKTPAIFTPASYFQEPSRYKAPVFQRYYVWGEKQLLELFNDIDTASDDAPEFLGAVVLQELGRLPGSFGPNQYLMIDGQQRLTTVYMILAALAWLDSEYSDGSSAQTLIKDYLKSSSGNFEGWPKLVPTAQDRDQLWRVLSENFSEVEWEFDQDPAEKSSRSAITKQWNRIIKQLRTMLLDSSGQLLSSEYDRFLRNLTDHLTLINIVLDKDDDANVIFSRLNAQGVDLGLADLVRNDVFSRFKSSDPKEAEKFYKNHWKNFEDKFPEKTFDQYFPVFAVIQFAGKTTKAQAFPKLQKSWTGKNAHEILLELDVYSDFYVALTSPGTKLKGLDDKVNVLVDRFARMPRTTVTWPFIIRLLAALKDGSLPINDGLKSLKLVESFLVRRAVSGWEPTGLHAVFKVLWPKTDGDPVGVFDNIITKTIKYPDDHNVHDVVLNEPLDRRAVLPYVLQEMEIHLIRRKKYDPLPEGKMTIEHVCPKNRTAYWQKKVNDDQYAKLLGTIGNLAPLSGKQNKSVQDKPWSHKKARFKGSNWKMTQELVALPEWNASAIEKRNKQIAKWICGRWPSLDMI